MRKSLLTVVLALLLLPSTAVAQDARTIISNASKAMGVDGLDSLTYFGVGANFFFGQNSNANYPWPRVNLSDYRRSIDFTQPALRATAHTFAASPPIGSPAVAGQFQQQIGPTDTTWAQLLEIWVSPWGFLKGAAANNATARTTGSGAARQHVVTWSPPNVKSPSGQPYRVVGYINAQTNLVDRVDTWLEHPIFGDMPVESRYSAWRDYRGVKFPTEIVQLRFGWPAHQMWVQSFESNPPNLQALITPPPRPAAAGPVGAPQAPQVAASQKLAEGVYRITGGYVALAVEFSDHIFIYEPGPESEARSQAILAEARRVIPNKPIRYGVISHHHSDHTGGLANVIAEGITIVTHEVNKAYLERAFTAPRTLLGDALAKSGRKPIIETMGDKRVFQDSTRTVELHVMKDLAHADGMLIAYLPKERIVAYADMFNVPLQPRDWVPSPHVVMVDNLERLKLDYDTLISVHVYPPDRPLRRADLYATIPGRPMPPVGGN